MLGQEERVGGADLIATPKKAESLTEQQFAHLEELSLSLDTALGQLESKLSPVLESSIPEAKEAGESDRNPLPRLNEMLDTRIRIAQVLISKVNDIKGRITL